ncbi:MAG: uncharacterized integral membrane protein SSO0503 [Candidatus Micrarchaeota archaeon]|nr:MAG: uncharacterized integral membrane protein SSO0503 [Candidatus Micrarchaeota archaeon]
MLYLLSIDINLWNPQDLTLASALLVAFLLGMMHGVTPDEHTWPITFSYSIGTFNARGGAKTGLIFSLGFTIQRAFMSELAYLALASVFMSSIVFGVTYIFVGLAMLLAGIFISREGRYLHWHLIERGLENLTKMHKGDKKTQEIELMHKDTDVSFKPVPTRLAFIHGLIAGFGFGAYALIIYTVIAPIMPNAYIGWIPGALFGLGTMVAQIALGAVFASTLLKVKRLTREGIALVGRTITTTVLKYGGLVFIIAGIAIVVYPQLLSYSIVTPIYIHNLHSLGVGFFIVIITVVVFGVYGYKRGLNIAISKGYVYKN